MFDFDATILRLHRADRPARIALAAQCAERVYPMYETYWVGDFEESVRRAIDISWSHACGEPKADDLERCQAEVQDLVTFYREDEEIPVLGDTVTVVLRALQALEEDEEASDLAVARAVLTASTAAWSAETMSDEKTGRAGVAQARAEEHAWQEEALTHIDGWRGAARRDMFTSIEHGAPRWLERWSSAVAPELT